MFKHLYDLAFSENLLNDPDFEWKPVKFLIELGSGGSVALVPLGSGKEAPDPIRISVRLGRGSDIKAQFIVDNASYIFGWSPKDAKKLNEKHEAYVALVQECYETVKDAATKEALQALLTFIMLPVEARVALINRQLGPSPSEGDKTAMGNAEFAFR